MLSLVVVAALAIEPTARLREPGPLGPVALGDRVGWACGGAVCLAPAPTPGALAAPARVPAAGDPADPRFPLVLGVPAGAWVGGRLLDADGRERAALALPPVQVGFDADGDGHGDALSVAPRGRVVLTYGPLAGAIANDPDRPGFAADRVAVYATGGESTSHLAWWIPGAPGFVAARCEDDGLGGCPTDRRTIWWEAAPRGSRTGAPAAAGGFGEEQAAGDVLVAVPGGAWASDGRGDWASADLGFGPAEAGGTLAPGGPAASLGAVGWDLVVVGTADGAAIRRPTGEACLVLRAGFSPAWITAGRTRSGPALALSGTAAGEGLAWILAGDDLVRALEASCGR